MIVGNWRDALARLEGAYADSTLRAYRADIEAFENWCRETTREAFPAAPGTIAAFLMSQAKHSSAATLKRRLAAIRKIHRLMRIENPAADEEVLLALRRVLRAKRARPQQALGLTAELRDKLMAAWGSVTGHCSRSAMIRSAGGPSLLVCGRKI